MNGLFPPAAEPRRRHGDYNPEPAHEAGRIFVNSYIRHLGVLRSLMILLALVLALVAPLSYAGTHVDDWRVIPTVVAPALMMVLVFVILLDMMMTRIFMANASREERIRLVFVLGVEALAIIVLLAVWAPLFIRIFTY